MHPVLEICQDGRSVGLNIGNEDDLFVLDTLGQS